MQLLAFLDPEFLLLLFLRLWPVLLFFFLIGVVVGGLFVWWLIARRWRRGMYGYWI